jgi:hypothetical protein
MEMLGYAGNAGTECLRHGAENGTAAPSAKIFPQTHLVLFEMTGSSIRSSAIGVKSDQ